MSLNMMYDENRIKCFMTFCNPKMYTFRGWKTKAWYTMLKGNKL